MADEPVGAAPRDASPTRTGSGVATAAGVLGVLALGATGLVLALLLATLGLGTVLAGLRRGNRRTVTVGVGLGVAAVVVAGALGGGTLPVLGATVCLAVSWDAAETALTNGEQVGSNVPTARNERTHLTATGAVLVVGAGGSFAVYRLAAGGLPTSALLALVVGGALALLVLRA